MSDKIWLVEIRLKDWKPDLSNGTRILGFEQVLAENEHYARHAGFAQFETKSKYEPATKLKLKKEGLTLKDCCAPEAVLLN